MKKLQFVASVVGALVAAPVLAVPIGLPAGPLYFPTQSNAEQISVSNSLPGAMGNRGIVQISIIQQGTTLAPTGSDIQGGGSTIFVNGQSGGNQILGVFYGPDFLAGDPLHATGGILDLYWWDVNNQNVGTELTSAANLAKFGVGSDTYTGFSCPPATPGCTFLGRLDFASGSAPGIPGVTISTTVDPTSSDGTSKSYLSMDTATPGASDGSSQHEFLHARSEQ